MTISDPIERKVCSLTPSKTSFYYGWVMLPIATLAFIATSPAQTFGISVFNESLRTSLNLSHTQLTGAYMLGTFLASLPMLYVGSLMDRYGLRRTMTVVVILLGGVCIAASMVQGLISLFFIFLLLRMTGQGALGLLSGNTLPFWFYRRLGTVEGIRNFGMALAIAVVPGINLWLIHSYGWRWSWVVLGLAIWGVMLPLMLLFRNRPSDVGQRIDALVLPAHEPHHPEGAARFSFTFAQARRTRAFWIVCALTAMWSMIITAVTFNIVPLFLSRGLSAQDAAYLFAGFAISLAVMQLIAGVLADRLPPRLLLSAAAMCITLTMALLWALQSAHLILPVSVAMGVAQGLLSATAAPLWARFYGTAHLGRIRGSLTTVMVGASSVGPFLLGLCMDWTGSYNIALLAFVILPMSMIFLTWLVTPPRHPDHPDTTGAAP